MKLKRLIIKNIGMVKNSVIPINKPLNIFFGQPREGKTTHLNAVRWAFGGPFPDEIITYGEKEASITLEFDTGNIVREFYRTKDGPTAARPLSFIRDGKSIKKPVDEIKKFLNPFLLDQDYLRKMGETERKQYFTQLFATDTSEIDKEIFSCESEAKELRVKVKMYGDIDLKEVKEVDISPLKAELAVIRKRHQINLEEIAGENKDIQTHNSTVNKAISDHERWNAEINRMEKQLEEARNNCESIAKWLRYNVQKEIITFPGPPDTSALESSISEAAATNVRAEQYHKDVLRLNEKAIHEKKIVELETRQRELKKTKIAKLKDISDSCKVKGLIFDENGNFVYEGTSAGMLSGSQIMKLSEELSNLYPKDLGIGLIDRAESLGKSVFLLIDRAQQETKTILATVVGEMPAQIPEEVGVFIVENGEVKSK